jgi:hypothetical protein
MNTPVPSEEEEDTVQRVTHWDFEGIMTNFENNKEKKVLGIHISTFPPPY